MWRYVAPAGTPVGLREITRWAAVMVSNPNAAATLEDAVRAKFGVRHAIMVSTGRAGLTLLLRAMRRLAAPSRVEVVVPAYTCYSVPAAVIKAGLTPRFVDISPVTLDYDHVALEAADLTRTLAVVATSLFGLPGRLPALATLARARGAFLIDDAAQAMGATLDGRPVGTWGDAGLYSFDKGKNVAAIDGGMLITDSDALAAELAIETHGLPSASLTASAGNVVKALAYAALLRPWLYWLPAQIPQLGLGKTVFTTDYPLALSDRALAALALTMFGGLDRFTTERTHTARKWLLELDGVPGIVPVEPDAGATPAYLRLPVLVSDPTRRDALLRRLQAGGIGATGSYPLSLVDVPGLRLGSSTGFDGGRYVAARLMTLPTHSYVSAKDILRTVRLLREAS